MEFQELIKNQIEEMESLLHQTHDMVKEIYAIVIGSENYKEASIIEQLKVLKTEVGVLKEDKIKRDANIKLIGILSGGVGALITLVVNYLLSK